MTCLSKTPQHRHTHHHMKGDIASEVIRHVSHHVSAHAKDQGQSNNLLLLQEFQSISKLVHVGRPNMKIELFTKTY